MVFSVRQSKKFISFILILFLTISVSIQAQDIHQKNPTEIICSQETIDDAISKGNKQLKINEKAINAFFIEQPNEHIMDFTNEIIERIVKIKDDNKTKYYAIYKYQLGKGTYGKVQLAKEINSHEKIAVKIQPYNTQDEKDDLQHEINQLKNIKDFYGSFDDQKNKVFYIFSKFADGTSVERLYSSMPSYEINEIYQMILSSFYSLKRIHDNGVVHNDVHEGNLVYNPGDKSSLWVDLAFAISLEPNSKFKKIKLPEKKEIPIYKAPESNIERGYATDIYQLGFMSLRMLLIFSEQDKDLKYQYINSRDLSFKAIKEKYGSNISSPDLNGKPSSKVISLLFRMMDADKTKRPEIGNAIFELENALKEIEYHE